MSKTDRFLLVIVSGALALVLVVVLLVLARTGASAYLPDGTPEAVVHNYAIACQTSDWTRAHGYLSPLLRGYPDSAAAMESDLSLSGRLLFDSRPALLTIETTLVNGDRATVRVRETVSYGSGLFGRGEYSSTFQVSLLRQSDTWGIAGIDGYPAALCWADCWQSLSACP